MHFKSDKNAAAHLRRGQRCARCTLCGRDVLRGEEGWYCNGMSVCQDCFEVFARTELSPYEITFGMEEYE